MRRILLLTGLVLASLAPLRTASAGWYWGCCKRPDPCRGVAILPPYESPDCYDCPVGGRYKLVPYYGGYLWDPNCYPPLYGSVTTFVPTGPGLGAGGLGSRPAAYGKYGYGTFSGANQDEANLLHLGGFGPGASGSSQPYQRGGDIIDRIQGGR